METEKTQEREREVEAYLSRRVARMGGKCLKYYNPVQAGYPDRVCLLPGGVSLWVELKRKGGRLSALQRARLAELAGLGHKAYACYGKEGVDALLDAVEGGCG